ncbi:MAG: N-acetyltransferase family protein [Mycobacteriales bacterium]
MADVSVRLARPHDAELIAKVQQSTWAQAYASLLGELDVPLEQVAAVWLNAIESPPSSEHRVLVALDGSSVVGFAASEPASASEVELTALMVEPQWGRRGHGSRLLQANVEHWSAFEVATTWVFEADTVLSGFLESTGWAFDGLVRELDTGSQLVPQRHLHTGLRPRG